MEATSSVSLGMVIKNLSYVAVFIASLKYLGITPESATVLSIFVIFDVITGMTKSAVVHGCSSLKSSVWERGVIAKCLIIFVPLGIALAGKGIGYDLSIFAQSVITVLILSELYSNIGNIYAIHTGEDKQEFDAVKFALDSVKKILRVFIKDDV